MAGDNGNDNPVTRSSNGFFASPVGISCYNDFIRLPPDVEYLTFEANCCNEDEFVTLDLTRFHNLKELHVKEGSLKNVKDLKLHGLTELETIVIGEDSFSSSLDGSFEMRYCSISEGLIINDGSFIHWNEFIISDCSIKKIKIGRDCFLRCEYAVFNSWLFLILIMLRN